MKEEVRQDEEDGGRMTRYTVGKGRNKMADSEAGWRHLGRRDREGREKRKTTISRI